MNNNRVSRLKRNLVACLALCLVLAGTAYASVRVSQHAAAGITCGGRCPIARDYWAYINTNAQGLIPGPDVDQEAAGAVPAQITHVGTGHWLVYFGGADLSNCARFANLTNAAGSATVGQYNSSNPDPTAVPVWTYGPAGNLIEANFVIGVFCGGGQPIITGG